MCCQELEKYGRSACTFCLLLHAWVASVGVALMHAGGTVLRVHCTSPNTQVNVCSAHTQSSFNVNSYSVVYYGHVWLFVPFILLLDFEIQFSCCVVRVLQLLLLGGEPLGEPIAARGPFVMNTMKEIENANQDFRSGKMGR